MKSPRLTLKQLAHFDRCIFPEDFARDLVKRGVSEINAGWVASIITNSENTMGIIEIAHKMRNFAPIKEAINQMLHEWNERFPDND